MTLGESRTGDRLVNWEQLMLTNYWVQCSYILLFKEDSFSLAILFVNTSTRQKSLEHLLHINFPHSEKRH